MRIFKYVLPILLIAVFWYVIQEFLIRNRPDEIRSLKARLWETAQRLHWAVGVIAVLIIVTILVRFLIQALKLL